jgi:hypothetical protein
MSVHRSPVRIRSTGRQATASHPVSVSADPASADALEDASAKLRKAGAADLNSNVLLIIVFVVITYSVLLFDSTPWCFRYS